MITEILKKKQFTNHFQPIVHLGKNKLIGYESLFRGEISINPETLFGIAHLTDQVYELDVASIENSMKLFAERQQNEENEEVTLSINVFPSTLSNPLFFDFLQKMERTYQIPVEHIILEINEAESTDDILKLGETLQILKDRGYKIALDDLGKGSSSLKVVLIFEPDIIKLDRFFSIDLSKNEKKQRLVKKLVEFVNGDASVVLEGIEKEEDLLVAKECGVKLGQGYFLGKPSPLPKN